MIDYFISDVHLYPSGKDHPGRKPLHSFLSMLSNQAPGRLWILGDLFDYWFEYSTVIPSGYDQTLCLLRKLTDHRWEIRFLPGNHDWWCGSGLEEASGVRILRESPYPVDIQGMKCLLAHGDGLGKGDYGYRLMKPVLRSRIATRLFSLLHPTLATAFASMFSNTSKRILRTQIDTNPDYLLTWVEEQGEQGTDLVVTGHTHCPSLQDLNGVTHASLGDWISHFTYLTIREGMIKLNEYEF